MRLDQHTEDEDVAIYSERNMAQALAQEREACAVIAEMGTPEEDWHPLSLSGEVGKKIARLIRARTQPK